MQSQTPNISEETLIERKITFRNSTFGGLKSFIREHERKTGERLTNAAAVDVLLRPQLVYAINRRAAHEMMTTASPSGATALQAKADPAGDSDLTRSTLLPADAAEHLSAYQQACGHANQMEALIEIIRTHAGLAAMLARDGKPMSAVWPSVQIANQWHSEGVRATVAMDQPSGSSAH